LLLRASLTTFSSGTNPLAFICWRSSLKTTINLGFLGVWGLSFEFWIRGLGFWGSRGFQGLGFGRVSGFRDWVWVPGSGFRVPSSG
jgi:hypothetical protein